jgi:hypothetical protein
MLEVIIAGTFFKTFAGSDPEIFWGFKKGWNVFCSDQIMEL